jgi:CRISPR/Cas system-associated exonuclease Cas4 (RecB family)
MSKASPNAEVEHIRSWSFSRLLDFESCAYKAFLKHVKRIPDPNPRTAADRGTGIHTEAELYVKGEAGFTDNLKFFKKDFESLREHYKSGIVSLEGEWGFNEKWEPCSYKTAWGRIKADAVVTLAPTHGVVIDFKTGKRFGNEIKHAEQCQLYSLGHVIRDPKIERVTTELWYLDQDEIARTEMTRGQVVNKLLKYYDLRMRRMTNATRFPPNPNVISCKYCPYGPGGTGHCKVGV